MSGAGIHHVKEKGNPKKLFIAACLLTALGGSLFAPGIQATSAGKGVEPTREQRLAWWREARFGMMITWGLYAVPAGVWKNKTHPNNYAEWIMFDEKIPVKEYERLAGEFNPVKFDARAWAALAKRAGMRYVIPLAKHHDGFSMYRSALTDFDIFDATPFKRDFIGELAEACRAAGLKYGCYYSVDRDWRRPTGPGNRFKQTNTWDFPNSTREDFDIYFRDFAKPQVEELLKQYRPDILWFDGIGMKSDSQLEELVRTIRTLGPDCIINSRIKTFINPLPDPFRYCDYISLGDNEIADKSPGFDWENPGTLNSTYAYSRNDNNWIEPREIVFRLVDIVSKGGNYLLNVGPTAEGLIPQPSIDRLLEVGTWMETNGEAIYGTSPWIIYGQGPLFEQEAAKARGKGSAAAGVLDAGVGQTPVEIRFTAKNRSVYAICLAWPDRDISVGALGRKDAGGVEIAAVSMLGSNEKVRWHQTVEGLSLSVPKNRPCRHAVVYKIELR
jgi:alpha-L-fucosidase